MASLRKARKAQDETPCLYRHYDATGRLLYVGISEAFARRTQEHIFSHWYLQISRIEVERFPTYEAAAEAELRAIKSEQPLYNGGNNRPDDPPPPWDPIEDCTQWQCAVQL